MSLPETPKDPEGRSGQTVRFLIGIVLILAASLVVFYFALHPPLQDIGLMAVFLSVTTIISGGAGYAAYRLGWINRTPTIRLAILGGYALASLLTFFNVWLTARLMFSDQHDLILGTVLLLFAGGIAMALGYILSSALTERVRQVERAANLLAGGNLEIRIPVEGRDEIASLAQSFNKMAEELQAAALQRQQLDTLRSDLIVWIGHDLQTPLTSVSAILEALADGVVDDQEMAQRYFSTAKKDLRALSLLIDDLFQMAQLDAGGLKLNREMISIWDLISDTLESFASQAKQRQIELSGEVSKTIEMVYLDVQRIGRVLNYLIDNALRHTPAGGKVTVKGQRINSVIEIEISDTGIGISPEDLPYVFDRFYRGEKSRSRASGGSGLGLAIAKGIIEAHGGEITVMSQPGRTSSTFRLPVSAHKSP